MGIGLSSCWADGEERSVAHTGGLLRCRASQDNALPAATLPVQGFSCCRLQQIKVMPGLRQTFSKAPDLTSRDEDSPLE